MNNYADIGVRFLASLIDGIVRSVIFVGIGLASNALFPLLDANGDTNPAGTLVYGLFALIAFFAYDVIPTANTGATVGKHLMKIRVVGTNGQNLGIGRSFLREVIGKWVSGLVFSLGYLWALWDADKQSWHDKIASTYVVQSK